MGNIKRKYFLIASAGVMVSALMQFGVLSIMNNSTPMEQTAILFLGDMALILMVDKVKAGIHKEKHI